MDHEDDGRWYRTRCVPEKGVQTDGSASTLAALGLTIDITDMKARTELEIENNRLIAEERSAHESNRLKSRFLANMSHEIRTPISGIIGLSELLSGSELDAEQHELTSGLQQTAASLLSIINDVLDFSKIESGHMEIESVAFRPSPVIADLHKLLQFPAKDKNVVLDHRIELPECLEVMGDPGRLRQVLTNLVSNSIKFTAQGSVTIIVKKSLTAKNQGGSAPSSWHDGTHQKAATNNITLDFTVEDTGCGISDLEMQKLFQPFSQADSSTARKYGGSGLGLSISQELVGMMGGKIRLSSEASVGTKAEFSICFQCSASSAHCLLDNPDSTMYSVREPTAQFLLRLSNSVSEQWLDGPPMPRADYMPSQRSGPKHTDEASYKTTPQQLKLAVHGSANRPPYQSPSAASNQQATQETTATTDHHKATPRQRSHIKVLVVEDNPINRKIAMLNMRKLGFDASSAENGKEALLYLDEGLSNKHCRPDIIFMDCQMPIMDGYEATQVLRRDTVRFDDGLRNTPVVALTASAVKGDPERCLEAGMNEYLRKPVSKDVLEQAVLRWTSG